MNYFTAFNISETGMVAQKVRIDTVALNLANVNTTRTSTGGVYQPLEVIVGEKAALRFDTLVSGFKHLQAGVEVVDIQPRDMPARMVHDPEHPDANSDGFVAYPNINPVSEMLDMMEATRAYEANVRAVNAAKNMALLALEIGD
jgi:flagellar basal-body rod protein FlgC